MPQPHALAEHRERIDELDAELIKTLAKRFAITRQVGELKARLNLPAQDSTREASQFERIEKLAEELGLGSKVARAVLRLVVDLVLAEHAETSATSS
jgi:chorismate mutase